MVVRQVFDTLRDTCFSLLKEIIELMEIEHLVKVTKNPMKITFLNGSEIIFKGCDKTEKLKSLNGVSIVWLEESEEITYAAFKELIGRLRTQEKVHFLLSSNPVSMNSWTFKHFIIDKKIEVEDLYRDRIILTDDTYYHHSTVYDNKYVNEEYKQGLENYKTIDEDLYRIGCLGKFGQLGVKVYNNVELGKKEEVERISKEINARFRFDGMDFGFSISYNAFARCAIDQTNNILYISRTIYNKGLTNGEITEMMKFLLSEFHYITADSSRPELIEEMRRIGLHIRGSKKGVGSVKEGIQKIKSFSKIIVADDCLECYKMMKEWTRKTDKNGIVQEDKFSFDNHFSDAIVYALEEYKRQQYKSGNITVRGV